MRFVICPVVNSWRALGARRNPFLQMVMLVSRSVKYYHSISRPYFGGHLYTAAISAVRI